MKHAVRLTLPEKPAIYSGARKLERHIGVPIGDGDPNLSVYTAGEKQCDEVRRILPRLMAACMLNVTFIRVRQAYPHVHVGAGMTAINWYLKVNGDTTTFYEGEQVDIAKYRYLDIGNGYAMMDPTLLTPVKRYVAKQGDAWMIDLVAPHSVSADPDNPDIDARYASIPSDSRLMMHATFKMGFDAALKIMKDYCDE